jgi:hypothetical protein
MGTIILWGRLLKQHLIVQVIVGVRVLRRFVQNSLGGGWLGIRMGLVGKGMFHLGIGMLLCIMH